VKAPAELVDEFRSRGLKITPQRLLLFRLLAVDETHPTAEGLHTRAVEEMPGISLRTVYTTLTDLVEMGELAQLNLDGGPTRFDPNTDDHHHVRCSVCGELADVYVDGTESLRIEGLQGFRPSSTSIVFHGVCVKCAAAKRSG
jgi:Fe2+ or Zn2+ uptake regulation protein